MPDGSLSARSQGACTEGMASWSQRRSRSRPQIRYRDDLQNPRLGTVEPVQTGNVLKGTQDWAREGPSVLAPPLQRAGEVHRPMAKRIDQTARNPIDLSLKPVSQHRWNLFIAVRRRLHLRRTSGPAIVTLMRSQHFSRLGIRSATTSSASDGSRCGPIGRLRTVSASSSETGSDQPAEIASSRKAR